MVALLTRHVFFAAIYHKFSQTIRGHGSELAFINVIAVIGDGDRIVSGNGDDFGNGLYLEVMTHGNDYFGKDMEL